MSSSQQHKDIASKQGPVTIAIVTVSDSRTPETDSNYHYLREQIERYGHQVGDYHLIQDEPDQVIDVLQRLAKTDARLILYNGGTGISPRDTTFDALMQHLQKVMPGFGELFRMLSFDQVGSSAMLSRAVAGVYKNKVVISTPGSPTAVQLAWEKLIAPEIEHLAWEVIR